MSEISAAAKDVGNHHPKTYPRPVGAEVPVAHAKSATQDTSHGQPTRFDDILKRAKRTGPRRSSPSEKKVDGNDDPLPVDPRNLSQWFRAETPPDAIPPVRPPLRIAPHQRVLVSRDDAGMTPQARIEISSGRMAGSQIQITANSRGVDAQLLTGNEASRQTLVAAMEAVRERLRVRGVLLASAVARRAPAQDARDDRQSARSGAVHESSGGSRE
ncbi:MAG: hypothetical protein ABJA82_03225 [Myxococcales bacterium]